MMETILDITTSERISLYIVKDEQDAKYPICLDIDDNKGNHFIEWLSAASVSQLARALLAAAGDQERPSVDETAR